MLRGTQYQPVLLILPLFLLSACETEHPTQPPDLGPSFDILDAVHMVNGEYGNEHFYWLPPTVTPMPAFSGIFDGTLGPEVVICELSGGACGATVLTFTLASGVVVVNLDDERYEATWYVSDHDPVAGDVYRMSVFLSDRELGFADLMVVEGGLGQLKNTLTEDFVFLRDTNGKKALDIRFRIDEGALGTTIDATALSVSTFAIANVGRFPSDRPVTLDLPPGSYTLAAAFGGATFVVTATGSVDYPPELDLILDGRGGTRLVVVGAEIEIDATAMSAPGFSVGHVGNFSSSVVTPLTLLPGNYSFGSGFGGDWFTITDGGTIDYAVELDPVLGGRSTTTLILLGYDIEIDATAMSAPGFSVGAVGNFSSNVITPLTVMPGTYSFGSGFGGDWFTITDGGTIDYAVELDPVLGGRSTTTLILLGYDIEIDATAMSAPGFSVGHVGNYSSNEITPLTVMPGTYSFSDGAGGGGWFTITDVGTIDYAVELDPVLGGRGTTTLILVGYGIVIDATAISASGFSVGHVGNFSSSVATPLTVMPGTYGFGSTDISFSFSILGDGTLDYDASLDQDLAGRGGTVLKVFP